MALALSVIACNVRRVPTHNRSAVDLHGTFRLNQSRTLRAALRKDLDSPTQIARALRGVMSESSFFRIWYGNTGPTARLIYAITTLLGVSVEEVFDPVPRSKLATQKRST